MLLFHDYKLLKNIVIGKSQVYIYFLSTVSPIEETFFIKIINFSSSIEVTTEVKNVSTITTININTNNFLKIIFYLLNYLRIVSSQI